MEISRCAHAFAVMHVPLHYHDTCQLCFMSDLKANAHVCLRSQMIKTFSMILQEVGPYDVGWRPRKHSWVEKANLLFVDNPVGTGYSYVEKGANFTTSNAGVAADLLAFLRGFYTAKPEVICLFKHRYNKAISQARKAHDCKHTMCMPVF